MKNNQTPTAHQVSVNPALIQAHSCVYRAMADVNLAAKIIRKQHDKRCEPNNLEKHTRLEVLMQEMLFDVQQLVGSDTLRNFANTSRHE